jgi:hypothetical protein
MTWNGIGLTVACLVAYAAPAFAQNCLHGSAESDREKERRTQALAAVRLINTAEANRPQLVSLSELSDSPAVRAMRAEGGPLGDTARALRFDREEVLPGWRVHFVLGTGSYSIALTDGRDPCGFTYFSNEKGLILQGRPITRAQSPVHRTAP